MEEFRSRSCGDGRMEMEVYGSRTAGPPASGLHDLRCYSASYASSQQNGYQVPREIKLKKGKTTAGSSSSKSGWSLSDPELQRKKRVVGYKAYAMEGKMKGSLRKSFRWLKERYTQVVYGWRNMTYITKLKQAAGIEVGFGGGRGRRGIAYITSLVLYSHQGEEFDIA
ncbi:uncharacterized protein LOC103709558 isoform X1 [Phoenix dactylifera]|uniref:Uncharacterized protein LOC103709558 isoform X1 n=2 Tax=Phoenix dactylifera TaxID=42345 RepID=A0A8B9AKV9_PHODC|nr:uncharacterized protein LOC103709558 isoform X1 [Phoenix dactylifera]